MGTVSPRLTCSKMAGLALACLLLVAVSATLADDKCVCEYRGGHGGYGGSGRAAVNDLRIRDLQSQIKDLQDKFDARRASAKGKVAELHALEDRVDGIEGNGCAKREFQCGGDKKECISDLLVCDGSADCDSGNDESEAQCEDLAHAGVVLEGDVSAEHCSTDAAPSHMKMTVISEKRLNWFPSVEDITVSIDMSFADGHHNTGVYTGKFFFGQRAIVIYHGEGHRAIDVVCRFVKGSNEYCHAKFIREDTLEVCGSAELHAH